MDVRAVPLALLLLLQASLVSAAGPAEERRPVPGPSPRVLPAAPAPDGPAARAPRPLLNACGGETDAVRYWTRILRAEDPQARARAARALGESRRAAAVPALVQALRDDDPGVRLAAVEALGRMAAQAQAALPALRQALADEAPAVRAGAERALRSIPRP
jgi:hypothetical protein